MEVQENQIGHNVWLREFSVQNKNISITLSMKKENRSPQKRKSRERNFKSQIIGSKKQQRIMLIRKTGWLFVNTWHWTIHQARWIIGTHRLRMTDEILKRKFESHLKLVSIDEWFICWWRIMNDIEWEMPQDEIYK